MTALRVLIVEDEVLIALELQDLLNEAGHLPVGIAATSQEAVRLGRSLQPDLALVDIQLADGATGIEVARELGVHTDATIVFTTANPPDLTQAAGAIGKPYTDRSVRDALRYFADRRDGLLDAHASPPSGLTVSPSRAEGGVVPPSRTPSPVVDPGRSAT